MAEPHISLHNRLRELQSINEISQELARIEDEVIRTIARDLEAARQDTIDRLAALTGTLDIGRAQHILAELARQQSEFELVWENIFQDALRDALDGGQAMPKAMAHKYGLELSTQVHISRTFLEVSAATLPDLIRGVSQEHINQIARILRQGVLAQSNPLDIIKELGKMPPFQRYDPKTGKFRPLTDRELRKAMQAKGPFAKMFRRLESIMRTEVGRIAQTGNYLALRELAEHDGRWMKEWSAVRDIRTRDSHLAAHGQRVPVNGMFRVGGSLLAFPLDPRGPADETINCRCASLPWHPAFEDPSLAGETLGKPQDFSSNFAGEPLPLGESRIEEFNPNHDAKGRFASKRGVGLAVKGDMPHPQYPGYSVGEVMAVRTWQSSFHDTDILQATWDNPGGQGADFRSAVLKSPVEQASTVYRGIKDPDDWTGPGQMASPAERQARWQSRVGKTVDVKEPVSTSPEFHTATQFGDTIFEIQHAGKAHDISGLSRFPSFKESVLPPGSFKVAGVRPDESAFHRIIVSLISEDLVP